MKLHRALALCLLLVPAVAAAQHANTEPENDPVLDAIQKFNRRDKSKPNEVTVVLFDQENDKPKAAGNPAADAPVPVARMVNVEEITELESPAEMPAADPAAEPIPEPAAADPAEEATPNPEPGLAVRVESLKTGNAAVDPAQVKLLAPFPAKPLVEAPAGWHLATSDSAPPFTREVEVSPGTRVTLSIRPHLLVPDTDGLNAFGVSEPGYDNRLGYRQTETVGAILATSVRQLDDDSRQLDAALDRLNQLLVSLPTPEPETTRSR